MDAAHGSYNHCHSPLGYKKKERKRCHGYDLLTLAYRTLVIGLGQGKGGCPPPPPLFNKFRCSTSDLESADRGNASSENGYLLKAYLNKTLRVPGSLWC